MAGKQVTNNIRKRKMPTSGGIYMNLLENDEAVRRSKNSKRLMIIISVLIVLLIVVCVVILYMMSEIQKNTMKFSVDGKSATYDESMLVSETVEMGVQVNGKLRAKIQIAKDADDESVKELAFAQENVKAHTDGKNIVKVIVVKNKICNIVVK